MEPRIQYTKTSDGVGIAYYQMGDGPTLVSVSGILWSHLRRQWPFQEYHRRGRGLGKGLRVVRYDSRGTGLSERRSLDFSMEARLRDLEAVLDRVQAERFALFGGAHGAPAAIAYAALHPERVSHLIVWCGYARGADFQARPVTRGFNSFREIADEDWDRYTLTVASNMLGFREPAMAQSLAILYREAMTPDALRAWYASLDSIDVTRQLPLVKAPTLVMHGEVLTGTSLLEWSKEIAAGIPNARLVTLPPFDIKGVWDETQTQLVEEFLGLHADQQEPVRADLPSGTAVILFADIADSTALTERLGDAAFREKARGLDGALRQAISSNGGTAIEGKLLGDGVLATFSSAREAIECASDCHHAAGATGLTLHVGIHAGDVIREHNNVYGGAVNIASRVAGEAEAGETLVSATVRELAKTSAGVSFEDRGEHALKGIEEPVRLYEVRWPDDA